MLTAAKAPQQVDTNGTRVIATADRVTGGLFVSTRLAASWEMEMQTACQFAPRPPGSSHSGEFAPPRRDLREAKFSTALPAVRGA